VAVGVLACHWGLLYGSLLLPFQFRLLPDVTLLGPGPEDPCAAQRVVRWLDPLPVRILPVALMLMGPPYPKPNVFSQQKLGTAGGCYPSCCWQRSERQGRHFSLQCCSLSRLKEPIGLQGVFTKREKKKPPPVIELIELRRNYGPSRPWPAFLP